MRSDAGDKSAVGDIFVVLCGYIMFADELYSASAISNDGKALEKTTKFFTIGLSPDGVILGVSCKVFVLHELPHFFIKDSIKNPKGVVAMGCLLRGLLQI